MFVLNLVEKVHVAMSDSIGRLLNYGSKRRLWRGLVWFLNFLKGSLLTVLFVLLGSGK